MCLYLNLNIYTVWRNETQNTVLYLVYTSLVIAVVVVSGGTEMICNKLLDYVHNVKCQH